MSRMLGVIMLIQRRNGEYEEDTYRGTTSKIFAAIAGIAVGLLLVVTQSFTGGMVFADIWTIAFAGGLLLQLINLFVGKSEGYTEEYFED